MNRVLIVEASVSDSSEPASVLAQQIGTFDAVTARFLVDAANAAAARWTPPDQGIWEIRGEPRHFVDSKLMCRVALDRAIRLAGMLGADVRVDAWRRSAAENREASETRGWNATPGAFAQAFDGDDLDASTLMLLPTGFLPSSDVRTRGVNGVRPASL